jgi:uncharacterized membrane protein
VRDHVKGETTRKALPITFLGEKLDLREGIGAGLIVLGAIVLAWK